MERLAQEDINNALEYDRIYLQRKKAGIDPFDLKRWNILLRYFRGGRLIDMGCLDSLVPVIAKTKYPKSEIWGIDIAGEALKRMQEEYPAIYYQKADVYHTSFPSNYFSYAVAGELIEHLENPEKFVMEAMRILKIGGTLALSTPKDEKIGEVDADRHLWSFSIQDIRKLLEPHGKVKVKIFPNFHVPFMAYHHKNIIAFCIK